MIKNTTFEQIAKTHGTPSYIYDLERIRENIGRLKKQLPEATILYAVKANANGSILKELGLNGVGTEVISLGELERSLIAGIESKSISLDGPRQDPELIKRAIEVGVKWVSLDSVSQWEVWKEFDYKDILFFPRLNPALDPKTHEHLATGAATSKFGMTFSELENVAQELKARGALAGFHVHAGSQISALSVYDEIFAQFKPLYEKYGGKYLNLGGGFHVPAFDFESFSKKVSDFANEFALKVILEPGRYLVADAGYLLTKVLHKKEGALKHLICDAGMSDLIRPALYGGLHPIVSLKYEESTVVTDVDGPLCENADRLGRNIELPDLEMGDLLIVKNAGAYGFAMSSNYASSFRPAEVVVDGNEIRLARRRETIDDLIGLEQNL